MRKESLLLEAEGKLLDSKSRIILTFADCAVNTGFVSAMLAQEVFRFFRDSLSQLYSSEGSVWYGFDLIGALAFCSAFVMVVNL